MEEVSAIVMYVGEGVEDIWYIGPGYYFGEPTSWMAGPYPTMVDAYNAFQDYAHEMLDDGQG